MSSLLLLLWVVCCEDNLVCCVFSFSFVLFSFRYSLVHITVECFNANAQFWYVERKFARTHKINGIYLQSISVHCCNYGATEQHYRRRNVSYCLYAPLRLSWVTLQNSVQFSWEKMWCVIQTIIMMRSNK